MNRMALVVHHLHAVCDPYHADGREQPGAEQERSEIPRKQDPKKKQDASGTRGAKQEGVSRVAARSGAVIAVRAFLQFASYRTLMSIVDNDNLGVFMDLLNRWTAPTREEFPDKRKCTGREVLDLVGRGLHGKEIAGSLKISPRTIEVYKARLMAKLGARNVAELELGCDDSTGSARFFHGHRDPHSIGGTVIRSSFRRAMPTQALPVASVLLCPAQAQDFPSKAVRIEIANPAIGAAPSSARSRRTSRIPA